MENKLINYNITINDISEELRTITDILTVYNCRITEILNLTKSYFFLPKFVVLKGLKGSNDIIIRDRLILERLKELSTKRENKIFVNNTYKQVYNFINRNYSYLIGKIEKKKNNKVTHCFRYSAVNNITDEQTIKTVLHHNSLKSNKYYTNKIKGK